MSDHSREMLQYAQMGLASSEAELLRIENHRLKQEIKELKRKLMKSVYGVNPALVVEGVRND